MAFYKVLKNKHLYRPGRVEPGQSGWIADRLLRLRALLNGEITSRREPHSLIIGSWNIRQFDGGRPRLPESFHYIAEIIDHFDICAIQEVRDQGSIDRLMTLLGPNWSYVINDNSFHEGGNHEAMAFVYNRNTVRFRHLVGELVLPRAALPGGSQIARTPFFAAFQAGWFKFTLCSAHIISEDKTGHPGRADEIAAVANVLAKRARKQDEVQIFLGDMNTDDPLHEGYQGLVNAGFFVPDFGPTNLNGDKHYDLMAFTGPPQESHLLNSGVIRWQEAVYRDNEAAHYENAARLNRTGADAGVPYNNWAQTYRQWRTHEISDHLPIWIELRVDYSNAYLRDITRMSEV